MDDLPDSGISDAKRVLLEALEALDDAEEEYGEPKRTYCVVCWAHQIKGSTVRGWNATDDPDFVTKALLKDIVEAIEVGSGFSSRVIAAARKHEDWSTLQERPTFTEVQSQGRLASPTDPVRGAVESPSVVEHTTRQLANVYRSPNAPE